MKAIKIKRVYDDPARGDGYRILVDRVWPRGVSKEDADLDDWLKELAPSTELRKWFDHDEKKWTEFSKKYRRELEDKEDQIQKIRDKAGYRIVTLLYGAKDEKHNQAIVLRDVITGNKAGD